jgi:hypothetical protein
LLGTDIAIRLLVGKGGHRGRSYDCRKKVSGMKDESLV